MCCVAWKNRMRIGGSHGSIRAKKLPRSKISLSSRSLVARLHSTARIFGRTIARRTRSFPLLVRSNRILRLQERGECAAILPKQEELEHGHDKGRRKTFRRHQNVECPDVENDRGQ